MSPQSRVGATCLIVGPLAALASVLIEPTVSEKASDQAAAVVDHLSNYQAGLALNAAAAVLMAAGLVWLAWLVHSHSSRLAVIGGALGVLGLFAVMLDNGLMLAGTAVAGGLDSTQATALMNRLFAGGITSVGVISVLFDIGIILLGIAVARAALSRWGSPVIVVGAIVDAVGFGSGQQYVAAAGFAVLTIGFAAVVLTVLGRAEAAAPMPAVAT